MCSMLIILRQILAVLLSILLVIPACAEARAIGADPNRINGAVTYTYDAVRNRTQKVSTLPGYPGGLINYNADDQLSTDVR